MKNKKMFFIIFPIILIIFLVILFIYFAPEKRTTFIFYNSDTGENLNGEIFFDNHSFGQLEKGNISVPRLETTPNKLIFMGKSDGKNFKVKYFFPNDYLNYSIIPFSLSEEDIDFYKKYYSHSKEDSFSNVLEPHFKKIPITWKLANSSQCWKTEEEKIRKAFNEIEKVSEGHLKFQEVYSNPDILVNCYQNFTKKFEELNEEIELFKKCENITFEGRKNFATNSELGVDDYTIINSGGVTYTIDNRKNYKVSAKIVSINDKYTLWEICKVNISDLSLNPYVVFDPNRKLDEYLIGEGGPSESIGNIIIKSEANFFGNDDVIISCASGFPLPEVHELLHTLGFAHIIEEEDLPSNCDSGQFYLAEEPCYKYVPSEYASDILSPYKNCLNQTKINEHYSSCLKYIYSNGKVGNCDKVNFMF